MLPFPETVPNSLCHFKGSFQLFSNSVCRRKVWDYDSPSLVLRRGMFVVDSRKFSDSWDGSTSHGVGASSAHPVEAEATITIDGAFWGESDALTGIV